MGSFSWCYCDKKIRRDDQGYPDPTNGQRMRYGKPGHVLFPKEFGGKSAQIDVDYYEDYGRFFNPSTLKTVDIYDLVADWNRAWLSEHPDWKKPSELRYQETHPDYPVEPISKKAWYPFYADLSLSREEVVEKWKAIADKNGKSCGFFEWRGIGIDICCYDEDAEAIPYPIKIARRKDAVYEDCDISLGDPYQGF